MMKIVLTKLCFLALCLAGAATQTQAQTRARNRAPVRKAASVTPKADAPAYPLSDEQKRAIQAILTKSKLAGAPLALLAAQGAKEFDENVLAEAPDAASDERATNKLLDSLAGVARLRLQTIKDVVALLTPEQKRLLRAEMSKPGTPTALLEVLARVFKLPQE